MSCPDESRNPRKPKKTASKPQRSSATPNAMRRRHRCSGDGRKLGFTKRVLPVGCFGEGVSMKSDLRDLTRIRLHVAIYFLLHRGNIALKRCRVASRFRPVTPRTMNSSLFDQVRQRFRLPSSEKRVVVFVLTAFLLGLVTKCYRDAHPSPPPTAKPTSSRA